MGLERLAASMKQSFFLGLVCRNFVGFLFDFDLFRGL